MPIATYKARLLKARVEQGWFDEPADEPCVGICEDEYDRICLDLDEIIDGNYSDISSLIDFLGQRVADALPCEDCFLSIPIDELRCISSLLKEIQSQTEA